MPADPLSPVDVALSTALREMEAREPAIRPPDPVAYPPVPPLGQRKPVYGCSPTRTVGDGHRMWVYQWATRQWLLMADSAITCSCHGPTWTPDEDDVARRVKAAGPQAGGCEAGTVPPGGS